MDKPTLQDVKEYFKNAKDVKCNEYDSYGKIHEIDFDTIRYIHEKSTQVICNSVKNDTAYVSLFHNGKYAEIISYKEPLYQLTAKEVVHAYENPQYLKYTFKECFETELEVGKWYKWKRNNLLLCITKIKGNQNNYYGLYDGVFQEDWIHKNNLFEPTTEKEVEEALQNYFETTNRIKFKYYKFSSEHNRLLGWDGSVRHTLFDDGVWAEILNTYTIPEAESKFNIKIKAV